MDKDKIVKAFDEFADEKYADSEETLRTEVKQAVNDFIKGKLDLEADPIQTADSDSSTDDGSTNEE